MPRLQRSPPDLPGWQRQVIQVKSADPRIQKTGWVYRTKVCYGFNAAFVVRAYRKELRLEGYGLASPHSAYQPWVRVDHPWRESFKVWTDIPQFEGLEAWRAFLAEYAETVTAAFRALYTWHLGKGRSAHILTSGYGSWEGSPENSAIGTDEWLWVLSGLDDYIENTVDRLDLGPRRSAVLVSPCSKDRSVMVREPMTYQRVQKALPEDFPKARDFEETLDLDRESLAALYSLGGLSAVVTALGLVVRGPHIDLYE